MTPKTEYHHDDDFLVTGGTEGCRYDNLQQVTTKLASWRLSVSAQLWRKSWLNHDDFVRYIECDAFKSF